MELKSTSRKANIELLRIVAMLLIIAHHFSVHGEFDYQSFHVNSIWVKILSLGGKIAVNIFVLISGCYYVPSKTFSIKKIGKLIGTVTFWSIIMYMLSVIVGAVEFRKKELLYAFFPYLFGQGYWFFTMYLELYLIMPLLSIIVEKADKKYIRSILITFLIVLSVLPHTLGRVLKLNNFGLSTLSWYMLIWLIGAYLGKYGSKLYFNIRFCKISLMVCSIFMCLASAGMILIDKGVIVAPSRFVVIGLQMLGDNNENAILVLIISLLLLIIFQSMTIKSYDWIFNIAKTTFGIYLLHDNKNFSEYMWVELCKTNYWMYSNYFVLYSLVCIFAIFLICYFLERLRLRVMEGLRAKYKEFT